MIKMIHANTHYMKLYILLQILHASKPVGQTNELYNVYLS